jgi:hypothetical protein
MSGAIATTSSAATLRGTVLKHNLLAIRNLHGEDGLARVVAGVVAALPADIRERIDGNILQVDAIPISVFAALHEAVKDTLGNGKWDLSHAIGSEAARLEFGGVYRVFIRAVQYDALWERIERTWNHIVGRGAFRWIERRDGYIRAEIHGVVGFNRGLWTSAGGRAERLLLMSGAKSAQVSLVDLNASRGVFEAIWLT